MKMMKIMCFFFLHILGLIGASQESSFEFINLHDITMVHSLSVTDAPIAVSVNHEDLDKISSTILMAETWLRTHVLFHYPATKITTIVAGYTVLCNTDQNHKMGMILPSVKNLFHSLTRWGLEKDIKISLAFSSDCFDPNFAKFRDENVIKPLLNFLQTTNSTYSIDPPSDFSPLDDNASLLVSFHSNPIKKLGFLGLKTFNLLIKSKNQRKPMSRKLISLMDSEIVEPYPARPTPLPEISPIHSSIGYSVPANIVKNPSSPQSSTALPPLVITPSYSPQSSPPSTPSFSPTLSPRPKSSLAPKLSPAAMFFPPLTNPPTALPPCNPYHRGGRSAPVPPPERGVVEQDLWCVAKPTVPEETLQEAMDYACGAGGADCAEIGPYGNCYHPDTIVAHASFAFNSYWQKKKRIGGTCSFGGTAMIIYSDPSMLSAEGHTENW